MYEAFYRLPESVPTTPTRFLLRQHGAQQRVVLSEVRCLQVMDFSCHGDIGTGTPTLVRSLLDELYTGMVAAQIVNTTDADDLRVQSRLPSASTSGSRRLIC